jgi:haloacetate dehalogenase
MTPGPAQDAASAAGFAGFTLSRATVGEVSPLLLLHGYPETHLMWGAVAGELAEQFTVVAPDLRGYGESSAPAPTTDHANYGKRAMAADGVALMRELGFDRFDVAGHDRGGRVAYRMALDTPDAVRRLTVLDVVPTGEVWARADARFALGYWQGVPGAAVPGARDADRPRPGVLPLRRRVRRCGPRLRHRCGRRLHPRCAGNPAVIRGMCEDYRAGATHDRQPDDADRAAGRRISCPTQVLWAGRGALAAWYDPLAIWREWADDVTGQALDCGHFIVEERPAETLAALRSSTARSMRSARAGPPRRRPRLPDGVDAAGACRGCRRRRAPDVLAAPAQPGHAGRAGGRAGLPPSGHRAVSASRRAARAVTPSLGKTRYRCAPTVRGER